MTTNLHPIFLRALQPYLPDLQLDPPVLSSDNERRHELSLRLADDVEEFAQAIDMLPTDASMDLLLYLQGTWTHPDGADAELARLLGERVNAYLDGKL